MTLSHTELLALFGFAALIWLWLSGMRNKEYAVRIAHNACRRHGLQLLDQTVTLESIRPRRDRAGRMRLFISYGFEFLDHDEERRRGEVDLFHHRVEAVRLDWQPHTLHDQEWQGDTDSEAKS